MGTKCYTSRYKIKRINLRLSKKNFEESIMLLLSKIKKPDNLFHCVCLFFLSILTIYLVSLGPIKIGMDSVHYLDNSVIRSPFYPIFLDIYGFFFGDYYKPLIFLKLSVAFYSVFKLLKYLQNIFNFKNTLFFAFLIILLTPYFFGDYKYANRVLTEGICYPLYLLSLYFLLRTLFERKLTSFIYFLLCLLILMLTRRQFFFMYPVVLITIGYFFFHLRDKKMSVFMLLSFASTIFFTELVERYYRYHKYEKFSAPPFVGIQLAVAPIYFSDLTNLDLFDDKLEKEIIEEIIKEMNLKKINFINSKKGNYENFYQHFSASYNNIAWKVIYRTMNEKDMDWFQIDRMCNSIALKLITNDPLKHLKLYFFGFKKMLGGYYWMVFYLIIFIFSIKKISSKDNELHLLICVSLLSSFSNYVLISLVEVPLMRYTIYTEVIQIVILLTFFYNALFVEKRN